MRNQLLSLLFCALIFSLIFSGPIFAQEHQPPLIETETSGTVEVNPDICYLHFNVLTEDINSQLAQQKNAKTVNQVITSLINQGLAKTNINTGHFSSYNYRQEAKSTLTYRTNTSMKVLVKDIEQVGQLLTELAQFNEVQINNLQYDVADINKYKQQAINQASQEAQETLEMTAKSLGMALDKIQRIRVSFNNSSSIMPVMQSMDYGLAQPQNPENIKITAHIYLEYSIKQSHHN